VPLGPIELARKAVQVDRPGEALAALKELRAQLDDLETAQVRNAVQIGWSWSRIAAQLGISKQAAHKKYAHRVRSEPMGADPVVERMMITGEARQAVHLARLEATALGADAVEPVHLFLGLLRQEQGAAARALGPLGISLPSARAEAAAVAGDGPPPRVGNAPARPSIAPAARSVLEQSLREAVARGDPHLGSEHLLLALLADETGPVPRLLDALSAPADTVRAMV
jgi:hypothetical protein